MQSPEAVYDALSIVSAMEDHLDGITESEIHLFGYLGCLISILNGVSITDWGYRFVRTTDWGTPFSNELASAISQLVLNGDLQQEAKLIRSTKNGREKLAIVEELSNFTERVQFIAAASTSGKSIPPTIVRRALNQEPNMLSASRQRNSVGLLEGGAMEVLYEHFQQLGELFDLTTVEPFVPAAVWLNYLAEESA